MKNYYMLVAALTFIFVSHAQENKNKGKMIRTEPNGVVVYEAQGVEPTDETPAQPFIIVSEPAPTLEELPSSELREKLDMINYKLQKAKEEEDEAQIAIYEEHKRLVLQRMVAINQGSN